MATALSKERLDRIRGLARSLVDQYGLTATAERFRRAIHAGEITG